nr:hypothetical protein [Escherichia coli]
MFIRDNTVVSSEQGCRLRSCQMAGEPECQLRTPRLLQTSLVVPGQRGACNPFCPAELHGLFEYLGFHRLLPRRRWSSRIYWRQSSEAGTTSSPDAAAVSEPSNIACHLNIRFALMPCRRDMRHGHTGPHSLLNNGNFPAVYRLESDNTSTILSF